MAAYGLRPCVEIQFADYMYPAYDQIVSEAARLRYRSAGQFTAPIVVRMPTGGGIFGGQTHSQSPEALFTHVAGLKTVVPVESVRRQGPADRRDRGRRSGDLPRAEAALQRPLRRPSRPAGHAVVASIRRARCRTATTPCRWARRRCGARERRSRFSPTAPWSTWREAAAAETGIDAEIIDLRTLVPLDMETIEASVEKTGRCVVVHEATLTSGFGAELARSSRRHCFYHLEAPIVRVTGWDTPYPHAQEWDYFPGPGPHRRGRSKP